MQHHPGSWYLGPWGVPLQKMLAVPFNPAAAGYQPQIAAAAVQQAQAPPPNQQQQNPYSHHQLHNPAIHHNHHHAAAAIHQQLNQQLHPAAAAMFTPLTLRSFVAHPHLNLSQQPIPTAAQPQQQPISSQTQSQLTALNLNNVGVLPVLQTATPTNTTGLILPKRKVKCENKKSFFICDNMLRVATGFNSEI